MNLDFENKMSPIKTPNLLISFLSKSMKISEVAFLNKQCALEIYDRPPRTMHWTSWTFTSTWKCWHKRWNILRKCYGYHWYSFVSYKPCAEHHEPANYIHSLELNHTKCNIFNKILLLKRCFRYVLVVLLLSKIIINSNSIPDQTVSLNLPKIVICQTLLLFKRYSWKYNLIHELF